MARPVWSGSLTFGLVTLPVRMYTATDSHTIHFHQLQRGTSDRIRHQRVNERTGEEVPAEDIVKGFDTGEDYVLVEPEELDDIAPGRSKALEITGFVDLAEVEPIFFDRTYYLGPRGKEYAKAYALLHQALDRSGKAGIATFVMRTREYLVAVKSEDDLLALHTLHWADEVRDPHREVDDLPARPKVTERELKAADQLIEALTTDGHPEDYHDTYQARVRNLVEAKRKGETVEKAEQAPESTNVIDLMDALNASLETAEGTRKGRRKGLEQSRRQGQGKGPRKGRGKSQAKGRIERSELGRYSKAELYELAAEADVRGRSSMNRGDLIKALSA
ncbi:Ku protein [Streptomyces piniterrae]|uniref:Non-homologous end joining protein Ku n=1 Tax=Streptomyces piniterrae TaxID=2571125 RepID=A0A4U0MU21_9ACTN|nr:Ku protein [Streptomyces piniterrae]TJZ44487.1 Ku protein [Streptomyces piniterrae]